MYFVFTVQEWSLVSWVTLLLSATGLFVSKMSPFLIKSLFVSLVVKLLILIGTHQTLILLGTMMVCLILLGTMMVCLILLDTMMVCLILLDTMMVCLILL